MRDQKKEFIDEFHKDTHYTGLENATTMALEELFDKIKRLEERMEEVEKWKS